MNKLLNPFALFLIIALTSCKSKMTAKSFRDREVKIFSAYCTNDVRQAEKALLEGLQVVSEYESKDIEGIDFDAAKAIYHERLFLIYRKLHETNKMAFEFQESMKCMVQSRRRRGLDPEPASSYDDFAEKLDLREQRANVRWKTNADLLRGESKSSGL